MSDLEKPAEAPDAVPAPKDHLAVAEASAAVHEAAPKPHETIGPTAADFDPNKNLVYDILYDIGDLELVGRLKWDIFSVEQRLERALREDAELERRARCRSGPA